MRQTRKGAVKKPAQTAKTKGVSPSDKAQATRSAENRLKRIARDLRAKERALAKAGQLTMQSHAETKAMLQRITTAQIELNKETT